MSLIKPTYKIIFPREDGNFSKQWNSCLKQITDLCKEGSQGLIRVNAFVQAENQLDYIEKHKQVASSFEEAFGENCPAFGVIMQEPEDPYLVICEIGLTKPDKAKIEYGKFKNRPYSIIRTKNYNEYWTIGTYSVSPEENTVDASNHSFQYLKELYDHLGLSFDNIVRQWNYVGKILKCEDENGKCRQHYQIFNETRHQYYSRYRKREDFPAATGIGMTYPGVCIDSFAVSGKKELKIIPISNPHQRESYHYGQKVLVGQPADSLPKNQAPQFERAKLIALKKATRLIISGTASIIGEKTIGVGDVEKQTRVTIQNIQNLSTRENLLKHFPEIKLFPETYSYVRVYVKHKEDIAKVKKICSEAFGSETPATYVAANICRNDLLVEIEAELVSGKRQSSA